MIIMSTFINFLGSVSSSTLIAGFISMLVVWRRDKVKRDQYLLVTLVSFVLSFTLLDDDWLWSLFISLFIVSVIGIFYYWRKDADRRYVMIVSSVALFFLTVLASPESDDHRVRLSSSEIQKLVKSNKDESEQIAERLEEERILAEKERVEAEKLAKEKEEEEKRLAEEKAEKERIESAKSKMIDVNYIKMYNDYGNGEYEGRYVKTAGRVDYLSEDRLRIRDGLGGYTKSISFIFDDVSQLDSVFEGDYVVVSGLVDNKMLGILMLEHSNIESIGGDAESLARSYSSNYEADVASAEKESMSEFKNRAKSVDYDDVVRNPHSYKDNPVRVTLDVYQVMENSFIFDSGYVGTESGTENEWFVSYKLSDDESRILEGDTITFYGEFDDVRKMKSKFFKVERYIPRLRVLYYE